MSYTYQSPNNVYTVNLSPTSSTTFSIGSAPAGSIFTSTGTNGTWVGASAATNNSGTIALKGENADVDINGKSLKKFMEDVEQRLRLLTINHTLEKEWGELKELGDQYRALEKEIQEKMKTWDILKKE